MALVVNAPACYQIHRQSPRENLPRLQPATLFKKETLVKVISCEFWEISKNTFFYKTPLMAASTNEQWSDLMPKNIGGELSIPYVRNNFPKGLHFYHTPSPWYPNLCICWVCTKWIYIICKCCLYTKRDLIYSDLNDCICRQVIKL